MSGRPSDYSEELADRICEAIATGEAGLHKICKENQGFPSVSTLMKWLTIHPTFAEKYARAKQLQAEYMAEAIIDIADDGRNDLMVIGFGDKSYEAENKEVTNRSRLRVDTRKWLMSKLYPKKYGDKIDVDHTTAGEKLPIGNIQVTIVKNEDSKEG